MILEATRRQATEILQQAKHEAEQIKAGGEEALRLAARDTLRDFSARIHEGFRHRLQDLVREELRDPQLIKGVILEIIRQATEGLRGKPVEILIPKSAISEQDAQAD